MLKVIFSDFKIVKILEFMIVLFIIETLSIYILLTKLAENNIESSIFRSLKVKSDIKIYSN